MNCFLHRQCAHFISGHTPQGANTYLWRALQ
jgi:hypothetical protein